MTLRVSLIIDGLWEGAKKALVGTKAGIKEVGDEAKRLPAVNPFEGYDTGAQKATVSLGATRGTFKALAREAALVGGPMAGMIGQVGTLAIGAGRLGAAVVGGTIAIAAIVATVYKAITAFSELEQHQVRVANTLAATRGASGQTVQSLEAMTRELAASGTTTRDDIRETQLALLRYKAVGGDTFGAVLRIARDVSASGFAPLKDAAVAIAKALDDPAKATEHLKEVGISLSVAQQRLATDFAATGQRAKATQAVMAGISTQFAGSDARAADTLGGAFGRLTNSGGTFFSTLGKDIAETLRLKDVMDALAGATDRAAEARAKYSLGNPLTLPGRVGIAIGARIGESIVGPPPPPKAKAAMAADEGGFIKFGQQVERETAEATARNAEKKRQAEAIKGVVDALEVEARTAGLSATAHKIYNEQVKAGVLNNASLGKEAREVAAAVNEIAAKGFMRQLADQFIQQNSALRAQAATAGMAIGPAEAYRKEQELLARAEAEGTKLSAARRAELSQQAAAYGTLAEAAARAKLASDISFERKTLFLSDEDVAIATRLRDLYANDVPKALASTEAAQLRLNSTLKSFKDGGTELTSSFFRDLRSELQQNATGFEALRKAGSNALGTLADKLSDMASKKLWELAFGGSAGGGLGGLLSGILGGGKASVADATFGGFSAAGASAASVKFDTGGYTGNLDRRAVAGVVHGGEFVFDADTTAKHRPLFEAIHSGRALRGYDEGGFVGSRPPTGLFQLGGGGPPIVHVHPAAPGETFTAQQNPDGSLALIGMMDDKIAAFSRHALPARVAELGRDPRARS